MSKVPAVHLTVADVDDRLARIARVENQLEAERTAQETEVLKARQNHADVINTLADEVKRMRVQLTLDALKSREQLLAGVKGKTVRTAHGQIRYQQQPLKVELPKTDAGQLRAIDGLKDRELFVYVRTREEIDRQTLTAAVQSSPDDAAFRADLEACGLQVVGGQDDVLIKPDHEIVRDELGQKVGA
ncbi:MAG TPA: host-nuclease inhibitor Gam family protein [Vicinamibacterales bacterium]|nr:host-nuclease inhibitor Gam family protein [Vicinamibacterales bacterium]